MSGLHEFLRNTNNTIILISRVSCQKGCALWVGYHRYMNNYIACWKTSIKVISDRWYGGHPKRKSMHGNDGYAIQRHVHLVTNNKRVAQCKRDESCSFMSNIDLAVLCWAYAVNRYIFDVCFKTKYSIYACSMINHPTTMRHWTIKMLYKIYLVQISEP